jgi:hypothetical protein
MLQALSFAQVAEITSEEEGKKIAYEDLTEVELEKG